MHLISLWNGFSYQLKFLHVDRLYFVTTEKILPVVKRQHLLLCTLLICNAAAMEVFAIGRGDTHNWV